MTGRPCGAGSSSTSSRWRNGPSVSEALVSLADIATGSPKSLLPHLAGQRFAALGAIVATDGPFAIRGCRVANILHQFDDVHRVRALVCHGSASVTEDRSGEWQIALDLLAFRNATVGRTVWQLSQDEAGTALDRLRSSRILLDGHLKGMLAVC